MPWLCGVLLLATVRSLLATSEHLAKLCSAQSCTQFDHPILDYDKDAGECVCNSHPCWNDNGQEHTCRGKFGFPFLTFFYNDTKHLVCECSSFAHYGSIYISKELCPGHRCVDPEHPVLDYEDGQCVCKSHPCWHDNGRRHTCADKAEFPILKMRYHEVNGRLHRVCECGISMEKDQTFPLFDYDKPGADPDEADFEDDSEEF